MIRFVFTPRQKANDEWADTNFLVHFTLLSGQWTIKDMAYRSNAMEIFSASLFLIRIP